MTSSDYQIIKDTVTELLNKIEYRYLLITKKKLYNDLKLIEYENRYLVDQSSLFESQIKDKDRALECTFATYTYLQHKYYLRSILNRSENIQEYYNS